MINNLDLFKFLSEEEKFSIVQILTFKNYEENDKIVN